MAIIPGMVIIGWAMNIVMLYIGLVLYSFGMQKQKSIFF